MHKSIPILSIIAILVVIVGYFLLQNVQAPSQPVNNQPSDNSTGETNNSPAVQSSTHEVIYTDNEYIPGELTIEVGDTVVFKNGSTKPMWTASAMHPTHAVYSGTSLQEHCPDPDGSDFDECGSAQPGESWSFTFTKTGTWAYHNHLTANKFGKITVE